VRNNGPELIKPVSVGLAGPLTAAAPRSGASAAAAQAARDFGDDGTGALF